MKPRDVIKKLRADGWQELARLSTSHRQFVHPSKPRKVTVTVKGGVEISSRDIESIRKQAGLLKAAWDKL